MRINKLELVNFRCFENYEITLSDRFTLLIGDNGSGKTAILDALKLLVSTFLQGVGAPGYALPFDDSDFQYRLSTLGQNPIKEIIGTTAITVYLKVENYEIRGCISNKKGYQSPQDTPLEIICYAANLKTYESTTFLPIISYYGTGRLWSTGNKNIETLSPGSRLSGYEECLNPSINVEQMFRWFKTQELAALQKQERRHILEAVREAIVGMIPDAKKVWWDVDWDEILIETTSQIIPFHLLSDGYRNMLGMVADIAYRMATLNPQLEADVIKQTEGIVLIDEIDLHLHPKWQREVVGRLLDTFPKVQFVASSHSPFIIQSLYGRDDVLLWDLEKAESLYIGSKSIEDIAENQQGVAIPQQSQRFLDMEKAAEEYYRVLKQIPPASETEKQKLKQRLDELLEPYSDDPAFQAFLKMERFAVEAREV